MIRTDLAMEAENIEQRIPGVFVHNETIAKGIERVSVNISSKEGEQALGKKIGTYVTIHAGALAQGDAQTDEDCSKVLAEEIKKMAAGTAFGNTLVVGLGNRMVTPDALGPAVCDSVFVTRHIHEYAPQEVDERLGVVSAISPGVLGVTGIETGEIIEGVVSRLKPSLIIAVDSLASRSIERVRTTIQLSDTGIAPGAGIGNKRKAIDRQTLGVPVIALGVPLVVYAATIAHDLINATMEKTKTEEKTKNDLNRILSALTQQEEAEMIVTLKEIDKVVEDLARIIADALNIALHKNLTLEETRRYMH